MISSEENYEQIRGILSPFLGVPLPKTELTDKLLHNIFTEEEAFIVAVGIQKALMPVTERRVSKRTKIPRKRIRKILVDMNYKGKLSKFGPFYLLLPYLPGFFEAYFTNNRDNPERMKKAGEAHYELIKSGFHVKHSSNGYPLYRVIPAVEPTLKTISLNTTLPIRNKVLPYEVLEKFLSKFKLFAVQTCSCRNAAKLSGNPCKRTDENFCVSAGFLANNIIKAGIGRKVTLNELMEIMKRAEKEGLVHETINTQSSSMFICNCCSCCCGFLKSVKEHKNRRAIAPPNFQPEIDASFCKACKKCMKLCPMEAIDCSEEGSDNKMTISLEDCIGCGVCASNCPQNAITLRKIRNIAPVKNLIGVALIRRWVKDVLGLVFAFFQRIPNI